MDRGAWQATVHKVARMGQDLGTKPPCGFKCILDQLNITDVLLDILYKNSKSTFSSSTHRMFSRRDCMIGHKMRLNKF